MRNHNIFNTFWKNTTTFLQTKMPSSVRYVVEGSMEDEDSWHIMAARPQINQHQTHIIECSFKVGHPYYNSQAK